MLFGPIVSLELVTGGRRIRFILLRMAYAVILLLLLWITYENTDSWRSASSVVQRQATLATAFFNVFAWGQIFAVLGVGPALTAGAIARERETRTLDYLLVSDLRNSEIILGKYTVRVPHLAYLLAAGVPILQLAGLMGGISPENLLLVFLVTVSAMITVAALGIFVSVRAASSRQAVRSSYNLLLIWLVFPGIWNVMMQLLRFQLGIDVSWLLLLSWPLEASNPLYVMVRILFPFPGLISGEPWQMTGVMAALQLTFSASALGWSAWKIRSVNRAIASASENKKSGVLQRLRPRPPVWERAMLWKECHAEKPLGRRGLISKIIGWVMILFLLAFLSAAFVFSILDIWGYGRLEFLGTCVYVAILASCAGVLHLAMRGATLVSSEKERDTWTTLLSTELTAREIVLAKIMGNLYSTRGFGYLFLVLAGLAFLRAPTSLPSILLMMVTLAVVAWFVSALGVLISLRSKGSMRAGAWTIGLLLFISGGYLFCCFPMLIALEPGLDEGMILFFSPIIPFLLTIPAVVFAFLEENVSRSRDDTFIVMGMAYVIGTFGYAAAAFGVTTWAVKLFDQWVGRTTVRGPENQSPAAPSSPAIEAETVDE